MSFRAVNGGAITYVHAPTGIAATDDTVLRDAITDTAEHGVIFLPNGGDTHYLIENTPLVLSKSLTILGSGIDDSWGSQASHGGGQCPSVAPYLHGSVIKQVTGGQDILQLTKTAGSYLFRDFGLAFDDAIAFTNTGHGINGQAAATLGAGHDGGPSLSRWDNLSVFGHDGNHYAYRIVNGILNSLSYLRAYGGGGLWLSTDQTSGISCGNSLFSHLFFSLQARGSAHGIGLSGAASSSYGTINLLTFVRPEVNAVDARALGGIFASILPPTNAQSLFKNGAGGGQQAQLVGVIDPDFESFGTGPIVDYGTVGNVLVRDAGAGAISLDTAPTFGTAKPAWWAPPSIAIGATLGTAPNGATASLAGIDGGQQKDYGGQIGLHCGSDAPGGQGIACAVTFGALPANANLLSIVVSPAEVQAVQVRWWIEQTATGFNLHNFDALTANNSYRLMWAAVPRYP